MSIRLRPAKMTDSERLREWRNEAGTLQASSDSEPVSLSDHNRWLEARLGDDHTRLWIAEEFDDPVGQVRLEVVDGEATVSVSVAAEARGRGLGGAMIAALQELASAEAGYTALVALVKPDNTISRRLFEGRGFQPVASEGGLLAYRWVVVKAVGEP